MTTGNAMRFAFVACVILSTPAVAQDEMTGTATTIDGIYAEAAADCATFDKGVFSPGESKVTKVDLTGDGVPEEILDEMGFTCSTLSSFYSGTGGSPLVVLAAGKRFEWSAFGFQVVKVEDMPPVLLMSVYGGACGGTGSDPCVEAVVWNGETFMSVANRAE